MTIKVYNDPTSGKNFINRPCYYAINEDDVTKEELINYITELRDDIYYLIAEYTKLVHKEELHP